MSDNGSYLNQLQIIKDLYARNENITQWIRETSKLSHNTAESVNIAYDFQAGTYIQRFNASPESWKLNTSELAGTIKNYWAGGGRILEAGVGEATTLISLMNLHELPHFDEIYGFDISWSRIKYAQRFVSANNLACANLVMGNLFSIPFLDDSIEVVYTRQSIEPNGGFEKEILSELYRVTKNYLILHEPSYELANEKSQARMRELGYVTKIIETCSELGFNVVSHKPCKNFENPMNPVAITVICKSEKRNEIEPKSPYCCPISRTVLSKFNDIYYSGDSMLAYPVIGSVPCLMEQYAVIATAFRHFYAY